MDNKPMFADAKVGDRVWSIEFGWGRVINTNFDHSFPILVEFEEKKFSVSYTPFGQRFLETKQTLFWDEIKFEIPAKPKKKVRKEFFMNIYNPSDEYYYNGGLFNSYNEANKGASENLLITLPVTFEVEE